MKTLLRLHRRMALDGAEQPIEWLLFLLLLPISLIYGFVGWLRNKLYDWHLLPSYRAAVPVVSVGNLAVGGTGKTPVVDRLVKEFIRQKKRPAVVSRGYGGTFAGAVGIVSNGAEVLLSASEAGDEPYLLARRNPGALVLIARKRAAGVQVAVAELAADVIILDDGFQHRAVQRDVDLVLLDAARPCGNTWPLPAGLLREFPAALQRADLLLLTRATDGSSFAFAGKPVFKSRHRLADVAISLEGHQISLPQLATQKLFAFAGIADPDSFFSALRTAGLRVEACLPLGDHCRYDRSVITEIRTAAAACDGLITTEKDAVKLAAEMFDLPCYQVPLNLSIMDEGLFITEISHRLWSHR